MGTQTEPEVTPPIPDTPGTDPATQPSPDNVSSSTTTPPTPPPSDPPINPKYVSALEDTLRENNRRIQAQQDRLDLLERNQNQTPSTPASPEEQRNAFFNNPHEHTRSIVADELGKQIKPLLDFVQAMPKPGADTIKNRIKYHPAYSNAFNDPLVDQAFDVLFAGVPNQNEQTAQAVANQIIGLKATGQLRAAMGLPSEPTAPIPPTPNTMPNQPAPPYVPPTPPPTPRQQERPRVRELDENERRLAREKNMTPEVYLAWLGEDPKGVVSSKIGRTP